MEPAIDSADQPTPSPQERRQYPRLAVDTRASLLLVEVGARLPGRILNLSMGGCLILTDNRFPTGVYRRIEIEFTLHGIPFRMGGVTQGIYDRRHVGVRFLDMSERKHEQLHMLLREIAASVAPDTTTEAHA